MLLRFTKMHGLGNDFMVLDLVSQHAHIQPKHAKQWGDRHTGIGFDQLLIVEAPNNPEVDFRYRIFNADGSEVEQCGNGARCFARFVLDKRLTAKKRIRVETKSGIIVLDVQNDGQVSVDMGPPRFIPAEIPFIADAQAQSYPLDVDGQLYSIAAVSMGNPHAVLRVDDVQTAPVHELGPKIENHPRFPQRVNAGFIRSSTATAPTCACGSAARAKPRPAAPARAPQPWRQSAKAGWTPRCPSTCPAAACTSNGPAPASPC